MKKLWGYIVGAFSIVLGLFFYERQKRKSAESLNDNIETKESVMEKESKIQENNGKLKAEEEHREKTKEDLEGKKNEDSSLNNLVDFFNRRK